MGKLEGSEDGKTDEHLEGECRLGEEVGQIKTGKI